MFDFLATPNTPEWTKWTTKIFFLVGYAFIVGLISNLGLRAINVRPSFSRSPWGTFVLGVLGTAAGSLAALYFLKGEAAEHFTPVSPIGLIFSVLFAFVGGLIHAGLAFIFPGYDPLINRDRFDNYGEFDREGYDRWGYNIDGYDRKGYNRDGYNRNGFNREGYDRAGYDSQGYDRWGYNRDGYNNAGFNRDGYDRDGFDVNGFDRDGVHYDEYRGDVDGFFKSTGRGNRRRK